MSAAAVPLLSSEVDFADVERATEGFNGSLHLGRGKYGDVYRGTWGDGTEVAVKVLHSPKEDCLVKDWEALSRYRHANLVIFLGLARIEHSSQIALVHEFLEGGSVHGKLRAIRESYMLGMQHQFAWSRRLSAALDAGQGLAYLQSTRPPIFHRNVNTANILLDKFGTAKLADFGIASVSCSIDGNSEIGTVGYIDPLYAESGVFTECTEIYAFGVCILELLTGLAPLHSVTGAYTFNELGIGDYGSRLDRLKELLDPEAAWPVGKTLEALASLALRCVDHDDFKRPLFTEVVRTLKDPSGPAGTAIVASASVLEPSPPRWKPPFTGAVLEGSVLDCSRPLPSQQNSKLNSSSQVPDYSVPVALQQQNSQSLQVLDRSCLPLALQQQNSQQSILHQALVHPSTMDHFRSEVPLIDRTPSHQGQSQSPKARASPATRNGMISKDMSAPQMPLVEKHSEQMRFTDMTGLSPQTRSFNDFSAHWMRSGDISASQMRATNMPSSETGMATNSGQRFEVGLVTLPMEMASQEVSTATSIGPGAEVRLGTSAMDISSREVAMATRNGQRSRVEQSKSALRTSPMDASGQMSTATSSGQRFEVGHISMSSQQMDNCGGMDMEPKLETRTKGSTNKIPSPASLSMNSGSGVSAEQRRIDDVTRNPFSIGIAENRINEDAIRNPYLVSDCDLRSFGVASSQQQAANQNNPSKSSNASPYSAGNRLLHEGSIASSASPAHRDHPGVVDCTSSTGLGPEPWPQPQPTVARVPGSTSPAGPGKKMEDHPGVTGAAQAALEVHIKNLTDRARDELIEEVVAMGFPVWQAEEAARRCSNVQYALDWILTQDWDDDSQSRRSTMIQ